MRSEPTDAEAKLWQMLRDRRLQGFKFRRQYPMGGYILDYYCIEARLCVELDGGQHLEPSAERDDELRSAKLAELGVRVVRFSDYDMLTNGEAVLAAILSALTAPNPHPDPLPEYRERGDSDPALP